MYFNNLSIVYYVVIAFIGLFVGNMVAWCTLRFSESKKIFSKEYFSIRKEGIDKVYIFMTLIAALYIGLLYRFGFDKNDFFQNIELLKYLVLSPMLIISLFVDMKSRILPNRLNLTIFEVGLITTFVYGINNLNSAKDYIIGMAVGAGCFGLIALIGWIVSGKEAMGLGDVKFVGALGLFFGINRTLEITLLSFIIGAILSIVILIFRGIFTKRKDAYVAFGPFIALAALIMIFIPSGTVFNYFFEFCKMLGDCIS